MTRLSVNVNKVALLRNSRDGGIPSVIRAAKQCIAAGTHGITVHPRPDQRHIRTADVYDVASVLADHPAIEFNIEGNPFPEFLQLIRSVRPAQCTLVPDASDAATSDHGWNLAEDEPRLRPVIAELRAIGVRVSLFMDVDANQWMHARDLGADRVELYTQPYAAAFARGDYAAVLDKYACAAKAVQAAGLGVNAGHDLNLANLAAFCRIPGILEISVGHALIADALEMGLSRAVKSYLSVLTDSPDR
jgi:pyridoxine 5-phosphate synthase